MAQEPYGFLYEKGPVFAMHGSPWRYDTAVPIFFMGPGIGVRTITRLVRPRDIAPTLSGYLGVKSSFSSDGTPLHEVLLER